MTVLVSILPSVSFLAFSNTGVFVAYDKPAVIVNKSRIVIGFSAAFILSPSFTYIFLNSGRYSYNGSDNKNFPFSYSLCHDVLAVLAEVVSGMRFSEYMKKNIFEPLDMNNSYYHAPNDVIISPQYIYEIQDTKNIVTKAVIPSCTRFK